MLAVTATAGRVMFFLGSDFIRILGFVRKLITGAVPVELFAVAVE